MALSKSKLRELAALQQLQRDMRQAQEVADPRNPNNMIPRAIPAQLNPDGSVKFLQNPQNENRRHRKRHGNRNNLRG